MRTRRLAWIVGGTTLALSAVVASAARSGHVGARPVRPTRILPGDTCNLAADGWSAAFDCSPDDKIVYWSARTGRHSVLASDSCADYCAGLVIGSFGAVYVGAYDGGNTQRGFRDVWLVPPGGRKSVPLTGALPPRRPPLAR